MACGLQALRDRQTEIGWPSYRWVEADALARLESASGVLAGYPVERIKGTNAYQVSVDGDLVYCGTFGVR